MNVTISKFKQYPGRYWVTFSVREITGYKNKKIVAIKTKSGWAELPLVDSENVVINYSPDPEKAAAEASAFYPTLKSLISVNEMAFKLERWSA